MESAGPTSRLLLTSILVTLTAPGNAGAQSVSMAEGLRIPVGKEPTRLAAADVNADGHVDLVVLNHGGHDVTILLGDGSGGFSEAPESPFPAGARPSDIAVEDFNGDGNLDFAVSDEGTNRIAILLGDGSGAFTPPRRPLLLVSRAPYFVAIGDINADENPDVATAHRAGEIRDRHYDAVTILLGDGKGRFRPAPGSPFRVRAAPSAVAFGDVSGDGILDVVTANTKSSDVAILLGGKVVVGVLIDEFGNLIKTQILEASVSGVGFEAAARAAVMKVKWLPAKRDGKAIRAWRKVPVFFRLKK